MPSGKTHEKINFFLLGGIILVSLFFGLKITLFSTIFSIGYVFGTFYLGPDLDTKSRPFYRWKTFRFIWVPYRKTFHHRSFWTHGFFIGDIVRFLYIAIVYYLFIYILAILVTGILHVFHANFQFDLIYYHKLFISFLLNHFIYCIAFMIGIIGASSAHILSDHTVSGFKRRKRKKARR